MANAEDVAVGLGMYLIIHWTLQKSCYVPREQCMVEEL